jgi:lipoprotein-anchoring transpeptidase ErfK/SrfK
MRSLLCALALLIVAPAAALAAPQRAEPAGPPDPGAPTLRGSWIAKVVVPTTARKAPSGTAPVVQRLTTTAQWAGGPQQLMVLGSRRDATDTLWLQVALARRPNGFSAWVEADHMLVWRTPWRVEVATGTRTVTVRKAGKVVRRFPAVVGAPSTPTPTGLFAVAERFDRGGAPGDFYGPYVLALTAFSTVYERFGGGPGVVAVHGRGGASLGTPLGSAGSHGCVRIDNGHIAFLAKNAEPGTPVVIR